MPIMRKINLINVHFWTYLSLRGMELAMGMMDYGKSRQPSLLVPGLLISKSSVCPFRYEFTTINTRGVVRLEFTLDDQTVGRLVRLRQFVRPCENGYQYIILQ